jgi:hypothetical protein
MLPRCLLAGRAGLSPSCLLSLVGDRPVFLFAMLVRLKLLYRLTLMSTRFRHQSIPPHIAAPTATVHSKVGQEPPAM